MTLLVLKQLYLINRLRYKNFSNAPHIAEKSRPNVKAVLSRRYIFYNQSNNLHSGVIIISRKCIRKHGRWL